MTVLLTGATGFIGSAILRRLVEDGEQVLAPVRGQPQGEAVAAAGAEAVLTDFDDHEQLVELMRGADAVIHTAASRDDHAGFDRRVATAAIESLAGTDKPYVHTGGVWLWGDGDQITETDPFQPPVITAWRLDVQALLESADLRLTIIHPGIVYGHGKGMLGFITDAPRTADGRLTTIGSGQQHWTTVHVDDLADLYLAVLRSTIGHGSVFGIADDCPAVIDLSAAVAGAVGVATEEPAAAAARIGAPFAEALLLDQRASNVKARGINVWSPTRPSLVTELAGGR